MTERAVDSARPDSDVKQPERPKLLQVLGPGLITGASDDDPSGVGTYSTAGAATGYRYLWTAIVTYPLQAAIQALFDLLTHHFQVALWSDHAHR